MRAAAKRLDALEVVEGLGAIEAAIVRLTGRRPEFTDALGVSRIATRACHVRLGDELAHAGHGFFRGCNAKGLELATSLGADPIAGPGRRQHVLDREVIEPGPAQLLFDEPANHFRRWAARIGG